MRSVSYTHLDVYKRQMQKFEESNEALSERRNIIVMADEAHRGQYGLNEKVVDVYKRQVKHRG